MTLTPEEREQGRPLGFDDHSMEALQETIDRRTELLNLEYERSQERLLVRSFIIWLREIEGVTLPDDTPGLTRRFLERERGPHDGS